jgi:hypothetical protein
MGKKTTVKQQIKKNNSTREEHDFYATDPVAIRKLCEVYKFHEWIWECACGQGHLSKELIANGYQVFSSDLINRGYSNHIIDFVIHNKPWIGDIITNPPFRHAQAFIENALNIIQEGNKVVMLLNLQFLESSARSEFFEEYPPSIVYVSRSRIKTAKYGDFDTYKTTGGSKNAMAWFIWEKGFKGDPIIKWFN